MPKTVKQVTFQPTYRRDDRGIWVLGSQDIPVPSDYPDRNTVNLVYLKPRSWAGDHRHAHQEVFVGFGNGLYIIWRDSDGQRHEAKMDAQGETVCAFMVPSQLPHVIENRSTDQPGLLYEIRDFAGSEAEPLPEGRMLHSV